jgi:hypothetical protein
LAVILFHTTENKQNRIQTRFTTTTINDNNILEQQDRFVSAHDTLKTFASVVATNPYKQKIDELYILS